MCFDLIKANSIWESYFLKFVSAICYVSLMLHQVLWCVFYVGRLIYGKTCEWQSLRNFRYKMFLFYVLIYLIWTVMLVSIGTLTAVLFRLQEVLVTDVQTIQVELGLFMMRFHAAFSLIITIALRSQTPCWWIFLISLFGLMYMFEIRQRHQFHCFGVGFR